jgi:hypothetical protein
MPQTSEQQEFSRLQEAVLYVSRLSQADETFGAVKLNKLLFLADVMSYVRRGRAITGVTYLKKKLGPVPAIMDAARDDLQKSGRLFYGEASYHGYKQLRTFSLDDPNLSVFDAIDVDILCSVVREWYNRTATDISLWSHEFLGWRAAEMHEPIPYSASLIAALPVTGADIEAARELEAEATALLAA